MALIEYKLNAALKEFAANISQQQLGLASHRPHPDAIQSNCIANARAASEEHGGRVQYGWYFLLRTSLEYGDYLIATHHAVWHNPTELNLVDVTPFHHENKHRPIISGGDLLFLVDDTAQPYKTGNLVIPLPSRFYAINKDPQIQDYIVKLQHDEYETYNQLYGSSFP